MTRFSDEYMAKILERDGYKVAGDGVGNKTESVFVDIGIGTMRIDGEPLERDAQPLILAALRRHPKVAWVERMARGAANRGGRFVNFGFDGMADITGQLKDGRRIEVECKATDGVLSPAQSKFLAMVNSNGGVAFVARSAADVVSALAGDR